MGTLDKEGTKMESGPEGPIPSSIQRYQMERLQLILNRAYLNVDFYRRRFDQLNLLPEDITCLRDLRRFPPTSSSDLADHYPYGFFAVPMKNIVRIKVAQATDGRPIVLGFTKGDAAKWRDLVAGIYKDLGISSKDIVQVAYNYSLFPGAFTFNQAVEAIGAALAPSATLSATIQISIMADFRSTVLLTTPSFAIHIAETLELGYERSGTNPKLNLQLVLLGPEPVPPQTRSYLKKALGVPVHHLYGVMEMVEPGMASECRMERRLHVNEEHFVAEIVNPNTGEPSQPGEPGELVLTTLFAEAYPLIRYRTGDIVTLDKSPCPCGNPRLLITPLHRRTDNRIVIRGIPVYPERIERILKEIDPTIEDFRLMVGTRHGTGDRLEILLARRHPSTGEPSSMDMERIRTVLRRSLGLAVRLRTVDRKALPQEGLVKRTVFKEHRSPLS